MSDFITRFFHGLFAAESDEMPDWIYRTWNVTESNSLLQILDCHLLRNVVNDLVKGKTCAEDMVVAEMLQHLDDDILTVLADIFKERLLNRGKWAHDDTLDSHLVTLLRKKGFANRVKDFRPIATLPVLYKLYSKTMLEMTDGCLDNLEAPQFAFRKQYQAAEIVFILRNIVEKALEWNIPVFVLDGDLAKAYDYTLHSTVITGLTMKGVPQILISAWVREVRRFGSVFVLDDDVSSTRVTRTRSLLQGDPAAPSIFNAALDVPASEFCRLAEREKWGYRLDDGSYISLCLFADNFWIFASSPTELAKMTQTWLDILKRFGWSVPLDETTWCTTASDENYLWKVIVDGITLPRSNRRDGFKAVGAQIGFDNVFEAELNNRIARTWRAFYKYKDILCCRAAAWKDRFQLLSSLVANSLFWCAGSWNLTARQVSKLGGLQQSILHKMVALRRRPEEDDETFMIRLNSKIKRLKQSHSFEEWPRTYHRKVFKWAGHVARMASYDPQRTTHRILQHKCWQWIRRVASSNNGNQLHGRRLRVWRWEAPFYRYHKDESWQQIAQDRGSWDQHLDDFVDMRCRRR